MTKDKCKTCRFQEGCTLLEKAPANYPWCHMPMPQLDLQTRKELDDKKAMEEASRIR